MSRFSLFFLKNRMLFANMAANIIGVVIVLFLMHGPASPLTPGLDILSWWIHLIFLPFTFVVPIMVVVRYERPIRSYLHRRYSHPPVSPAMLTQAQRRLLNEPFFLIALDLVIWLTAAMVYPLVFWAFHAPEVEIIRAIGMGVITGLITTASAFFILEHVLQRHIVHHLFPEGGLSATPKTLRIRISTRLGALVLAANIVPFAAMINAVVESSLAAGDPAIVLGRFQSMVLTNAMVFMGVGISLAMLVSGNLRQPLEEIIRVLKGVRTGRFDEKVRVTLNDEIGYAGDVINEMTEGLKERELIKDAFGKYVAKEVRDEVLSGRVPLDGEKKDVTVLFADLRDFTPMTEQNDPKLVIRIMNSYFEAMVPAIKDQGGLVLQFIGDEIYAVFGAPVVRPDHPARAFRAGMDMNRRLAALNEEFAEKGWPGLRHGIGIHSGEALAANIGSPDRLSYLLVGDTVNLASRLQSLTKERDAELIISAATHGRLPSADLSGTEVKRLPPARVKGRSQTVEIFAVGE
jgi:adenylate cyclase